MKSVYLHIIIILSCTQIGLAQISPGELTTAHAKLEGMSNCTQCHELGSKVTDQKCLSCHTEIRSLITKNRGFHANSQVKNQACVKCHSEHHGRNFDMIRFNETNFNHDRAGYTLEGAHKNVDCRECHAPENIANSDIRKRNDTYLGLDTKCLSCHDDFHQGSLSNDCLSCHNMDSFLPVTQFDHNTADFKLKGEHKTVDCKECHKTVSKNGRDFQQFTDIAFEDCKACHNDPHDNQLPGNCAQCHNETAFSSFSGKGNFNHNRTNFDLKGAHKKVDCFSCHAPSSNPLRVFQDNIATKVNNCVACHEDPHENKYGQDCAKCHSEESFLALKDMDFFDHTITDFPLEGMHTDVDCRACHVKRFADPIDFSACKNCHDDYHNQEFAKNGISPDCKECHSLQKGFDYTSFTISDHQKTDFPLEGAHIATPCFACHVDEASERWTFADLGSKCVDCHVDIHSDFIPKEYYPENDCASCHGSESWDMISFDHSSTNWPLTGRHNEISCKDCHFEISSTNEVISQNFSNLTTDCNSCHENIHDDSFAINGVTDCARCHVTNSWFPEKFDHNSTRFPLTGKHEEVDCKVCHETGNDKGEPVVIYKINKLNCIDCHS